MYRALIEATAFGTRKIIDTFEESGVPVQTIYATGGISQKNELAMQIFADIAAYIENTDQPQLDLMNIKPICSKENLMLR